MAAPAPIRENSMSSPLLRYENLTIPLPGNADRAYAVQDLSLTLAPHEILCIVGESGSGKSLTALSTMGLLEAQFDKPQGGIYFGPDNLLDLNERQRAQKIGGKISMIFQEPMASLNPFYTVGQQVSETFRIHTDLSKAQIRQKVLALFDEVLLPDPERIYRSYPHQLSGGQCQRVMIASALALNPQVLIADEPTTALDVTTQAQILKLMLRLRESHGTGILFITHDFGVVAEIADRVAVMRHGQVVEIGAVAQVLNDPQHEYTKSLVAAVPRLLPRNARQNLGPAVLRAENVKKTFSLRSLSQGRKDIKAVDDVTLTLRRGETLGLVGESGSGKSTLAQCIIRMVQPDSGVIEIDGIRFDQLGKRALRDARRHVQIIFQDPYTALDPRQKVGDAIAEGQVIHGASMAQAAKRTAELLKAVGLDASAADRFPHQFSGGQRQRICIARALALEPSLLIADESVSALDVSVQAQILALLADIQSKLQFGLLFVTHDLRVASQLCDRIAVMQRGQLVEIGEPAQLFQNPSAAYTRQLLSAVPGAGWVPRAADQSRYTE
ncbi:ABC transporter ATP-binding protein (plasmid) [Ketogulonicigenium vulgare Y25]|uniref:ABC transporter nucleotide binding/ATPase protein (Peptide) n=2 Tax=Ketogulonicigenium vulgare TaxID=92945 RepID=F9YAV8_KETVW|nr:ABC transporter ATP-binding protein [Ketogulonicigenium vulgare Y25]AEM42510.1 ABC transporter nucleotide binding/ATPase protein (Peptide) [Ketogulonicigenium vulgare WSH-001]AOZ53215.1 ABC transporter ATP-binding protein [Ketogulonicigenium vulgare]